MFDSGITAKQLIDELKNEVDVAIEIPDSSYVSWLNSLQQLLYTEVIKEQREALEFVDKTIKPLRKPLSEISFPWNESTEKFPIFEDIHAVYFDRVQLIKTTVASGEIFPNSYHKSGENIALNISTYLEELNETSVLAIVYFVRPAIIDVADIETATVRLPIEFIDLVKAKLRGEAYKLANEDSLAAKWLNDYNVLLETFRAWMSEKSANFGL